MARKVFISILGTGYYEKTKYFFDEINGTEKEVRFVQESNIEQLCSDWGPNSKVFIFLTEKAREENWNSPAKINDFRKRKPYTGLKNRIEELGFEFDIEDVSIPDGLTEQEIWQIFQEIFNKLEDRDEVYFDITHAFRYLPMLLMALISYAKFLKNIEVKSITYGNYEVEDDNKFSPIINLLPYSKLQDWTAAAHELISFGSVDTLVELSFNEIKPILRETAGADKTASRLRQLNNELPKFVNNIQTCRGVEILQNKPGFKINEIIAESLESKITPLEPILKKIESVMRPFRIMGDVENSLSAVQWCINYGLIQQGVTILKETLTTLVCREMNIDYKVEENRNIIDSSFKIYFHNIQEDNWLGDAGQDKAMTKNILENSKLIPLLSKDFDSILNIRNDINHSGFKPNYIRKPEKFKNLLQENLLTILKKIKPESTKRKETHDNPMLLNLSNHPSTNWPQKQRQKAIDRFGAIEDIDFPAIDPEASTQEIKLIAGEYAEICLKKLKGRNKPTVHIMGELTFSFTLVALLQKQNIKCIASTTIRDVKTVNGNEKQSKFNFVQFREYPLIFG